MRETNVAFIFKLEDDLRRYMENALSNYKQVKLFYPEEETEGAFAKICRDADIIVGWRPSMELIEKSRRFSLLIFPGAGAHNVVEKFRKLDREPKPILINGHGNSYFTAQHTVAMLLALMGKVIPHHNWMIKGRWRTGDEEAMSISLKNRHVGFLGYGAVNSKVHKFLSGFDLEFSALRHDWSRQKETPPTQITRYEEPQLRDFLKAIDILIIAVPVTPRTESMIGRQELAMLGENGILVNIARGKVVNEQSLYDALRKNTIAGAALDVWYDYTPEPDKQGRKYPYSYPFHELDNVILSPHRAASPFNDLERWDEVIENIKRFAKGSDDYINVVDLEQGY